ncbi:MAG: hypothetical protein ABIE07_09755 [Candidatus Zixiibacteriota bacterium]
MLKRTIKYSIAFLFLVLMIISCEESFEPDQPVAPIVKNQSPAITSMSSSRTNVPMTGFVVFSCKAKDPYGDSLFFLWSSQAGTFPAGESGNPVTWQAPEVEGLQIIKVIVSDSLHQISDSISVIVE